MKKLGLFIMVLALQASIGAMPRPAIQARGAGASERPNILFILADDLGAESSAIYPDLYNPASFLKGHGQVPTPTLSALASRGVVFDNVWANPVCSPTRAALLSGLYGHNTGVTTVGNVLPGDTTSIFELLAASPTLPPYKMAVFGKWHLSGANGTTSIDHVTKETGVPLFKGFLGSHITNYYDWTLDSSTGPPTNTKVYSTTLLTNFAIDFIKDQKPGEPWFLYLPYNAPHGTAPNSGFQVPPKNLFTVDVGGRPADGKIYSNDVPVYQAIIQALDTEIGRLFKAMQQAGQFDNTVIIFMGDNGTPAPAKDSASRIWESKGSVYEGGVRVPLIVAGAGVTRRGREPQIINDTDMYATIAQLAGVPIPVASTNNSYSFAPLLTSDTAVTGRKYSFTEICANNGTGTKQFAIRNQRYKILYNGMVWQMFDLQTDPWEGTNIFARAENSAERASLLEELRTLKMKAASSGCFVDIPTK
jgi:arylsulfatase A-like enzyme